MGSATPLTDLLIRKLKAEGAQRVEAWDDKVPGLGIRVSSAGTKSFVLLYRLNGRSARMTLGRYPVLGLADARRLATEALRKVTHGEDPQGEKVERRTFPRFDDTVAEFLRIYCGRQNRQSTARETERILNARFVPRWAARDIREIKRHDILTVLDAIVEEGKPSAANHAFAAVRKLLSWCVARGIIETNPCTGISAPSPVVERERVLGDDELAAIWQAAGATGYPYGTIVRLLILTGQRRGEVTGLRWTEIDLGQRVWSLPAERTKNGRPHQVPLTAMAADIIAAIPRTSDTFVFPARSGDASSFSGFSKLKHRLDELSGVRDWTLHDLRRTTATGLAGLGVAPHVVEKLLNHTTGALGGVAGIYNRFQYMPEMRQALERWEARIAGSAS